MTKTKATLAGIFIATAALVYAIWSTGIAYIKDYEIILTISDIFSVIGLVIICTTGAMILVGSGVGVFIFNKKSESAWKGLFLGGFTGFLSSMLLLSALAFIFFNF